MRSIPKILGILFIWIISEMIIYSSSGTSILSKVISIGIAFIIGAYFFF